MRHIYHFYARGFRQLLDSRQVVHIDGIVETTDPILDARRYVEVKAQIAERENLKMEDIVICSLSALATAPER